MDKLSDLPPKNDTIKTPEETALLSQFFGASSPGEDVNRSQQGSLKSRLNWKMIGIATLSFVLLANPWIDKIFCKIPHCGSPAAILGIKTVLFLLVVLALSLFV